MESTRRRLGLGVPFALIGAAGGWYTADWFGLSSRSDEPIRWLLAGVTPLTALALGGLLAQRVASWPRGKAIALVVLSILIAGVLNGVAIGIVCGAGAKHTGAGMYLGAIMGGLCALPFVPALGSVVAAVRRARGARPGSLVDRARRRRVWLATATSVALASVAGMLGEGGRTAPEHRAISAAICASAAVIVTALVILAARDWLVARAIAASEQRLRPHEPKPDDAGGGPPVFDLGVGEETSARVRLAPTAYRRTDTVVQVFRGSPSAARAVLGAAFGLSVGGWLAAVLALLAHVYGSAGA